MHGIDEKKYRLLIETSPNAVMLTDRSGIIRIVNQQMVALHGYENPEELTGKNARDLLSPKNRSRIYRHIKTMLKEEIIRSEKCIFLKKDGTEFIGEINASVVADEKKKIRGFILITTDISKRESNEERLASLNREVELKKQELQAFSAKINEEISKVEDFYRVFFPKNFPDIDGLSFAVYYQPAKNIGGDLYNIIRVGDQLMLYLVDVMGHGVEGALIGIFIRETLHSFISRQENEKKNVVLKPSSALSFLSSRYSKQSFPDDYLVSIFLGILDLKADIFTFAAAGHHISPILSSPQGQCLFLRSQGLPLSSAIEQSLMIFLDQKISFLPGSTFLFTTDGLVEENRSGEMYGEIRLRRVFAEASFLPPELIVNAINLDYWKFRGRPGGQDDISFVVMQHSSPPKMLFSYISKNRLLDLETLEKKLAEILTLYLRDTGKLLKAFHEIARNALVHGCGDNTESTVQVELFIHENCLYITVEDEGEGFEWYKTCPKYFADLAKNGRGIITAGKCLDHLSYNEKGNKAYLVKRRDL